MSAAERGGFRSCLRGEPPAGRLQATETGRLTAVEAEAPDHEVQGEQKGQVLLEALRERPLRPFQLQAAPDTLGLWSHHADPLVFTQPLPPCLRLRPRKDTRLRT